MAKKNIAGLGGGVTMPTGFNAKINAWSVTIEYQDVEVTGFDSGGHAEFEPTKSIVTGSATGTLQYDDTNAKPFPLALADGSAMALGDFANLVGSLTLTAVTGCTLVNTTALINGLSIERPVDGKATVTFNFKFSGAWTLTWDETA